MLGKVFWSAQDAAKLGSMSAATNNILALTQSLITAMVRFNFILFGTRHCLHNLEALLNTPTLPLIVHITIPFCRPVVQTVRCAPHVSTVFATI